MTTATATISPAQAAALADGLAELAAGVDHDLRDRLRGLQREAEAWLASNDPAEDWSGFERWLDERARREIAENHGGLRDGAARLAAETGVAIDVAIEPPATPPAEALLSPSRPAAAELGLTAVRGACGGVITASLLGNLAGLAVAGPAAVVVGLAFGAKTLRDDRTRLLGVRRAEARVVVQRYVDEVVFQCANASRRSLREVQRRFRTAIAATPASVAATESVPVDDRTVALAPLRRTVEHPPVTSTTRRSSRRPAALAAAVLVAIAIALAMAHGDTDAPRSGDDATPATSIEAPASDDGAAAFVTQLVAATRDGRTDVLVDRLHPAVIERYGVDACRDYLTVATAFPIDLTVRETSTEPAWTWETDGVRTPIADVVLVEVSRVVDGETVLQELHLAVADGALGWFTDCGEPINR